MKAGLGSLLVIVCRDDDGKIVEYAAAIVDGERIKADTWYCLKDRELTEVNENGSV